MLDGRCTTASFLEDGHCTGVRPLPQAPFARPVVCAQHTTALVFCKRAAGHVEPRETVRCTPLRQQVKNRTQCRIKAVELFSMLTSHKTLGADQVAAVISKCVDASLRVRPRFRAARVRTWLRPRLCLLPTKWPGRLYHCRNGGAAQFISTHLAREGYVFIGHGASKTLCFYPPPDPVDIAAVHANPARAWVSRSGSLGAWFSLCAW